MVTELERGYGDRLVYVAAYGSLARASATPLSDIDLLAVVDDGKKADHSWLYGTTPVDVHVRPLEEVKDRILRIDGFWPHVVGSLLEHRVYLDRGRVARKLRLWHGQAVGKMEGSIQPSAGFYEYLGKMERGWDERNPEVMRRAAWEIFFMSCMDLALLNKRFFTDHMRMIEQIEDFDFVPPGFLEHARDLFHSDLERVYDAARGLFEIHRSLAKEFSYEMKSLTRMEQIRI